MCGRFTHRFTWRQLAELMELLSWTDPELEPRFNVAPTQVAPVVRRRGDGAREGVLLRWGLVPRWSGGRGGSGGGGGGGGSFNARSETVGEKPSFREAFRQRRCLVPMSGFYEWRALREGKQPYYITRRDGAPFAAAGLWEPGVEAGGGGWGTFTVLTTRPNGLMARLHDRMPVIVEPGDYGVWLGGGGLAGGEAERLFEPRDDASFEAYPVGRGVSRAGAEGPGLTERVAEIDPGAGFLF